MEKDKYYVPTIEEFHVGFEYEKAMMNSNWEITKWKKDIFNKNDSLIEIEKYINLQRVKYLDRHDILSLGFKQVNE